MTETAEIPGWTERQLPYVELYGPRVVLGAQFMDRTAGDWYESILERHDVGAFDMRHSHSCVLGHVGREVVESLRPEQADGVSDYITTLVALFGGWDASTPAYAIALALGFVADCDGEEDDVRDILSPDGEAETALAYGVLGDLWLLEARRRVEDAEAETQEVQAEIDERLAGLVERRNRLVVELREVDEEIEDLSEIVG
jgi:hypothetical protein